MIRISMDKRFKIGTAFNICLLLFFGFFSVYQLYSMNKTITTGLESDIKLIITSEKAGKDLYYLQQKYKKLDITEQNKHLPQISQTLGRLNTEFSQLHKVLELLTGNDSHLLTEIEPKTDLRPYLDKPSEEIALKKQELVELMQKLHTQIVFIRNHNLNFLAEQKNALSALSKSHQSKIATVTIFTAMIAFIILLFLSHQIRLPTRKIIEIIRKVRDGNYSIPSRRQTGNEIDQIVAGLSIMAENLKIRDHLKLEKIQLEKKRFATLANFLSAPLFMINDEKKVAFANDEFLTLFKLGWDDIYEVTFQQIPLPAELKEKLTALIAEKKWVENEPWDIIGDNYAFELYVSLIPVKTTDNSQASLIVSLGKIDCRKKSARMNA